MNDKVKAGLAKIYDSGIVTLFIKPQSELIIITEV
jgi:hypothetical protein